MQILLACAKIMLSKTEVKPPTVSVPQFQKEANHYALQMRLDDVTNSSSGGTSPRWYTLSQQDLHFIRDTIQKQRPGDWARIKGRLFFNQTNTPYFK